MTSHNEPLSRHAVGHCQEVLADTPILLIQGARQVGKTTLARDLLDTDRAAFFTLDNSLTREFAQSDPHGFVAQANDQPIIIDEVQRAPELVLALKAAVDEDRRPGRFILTGSVDLFSTSGVADSIAGRVDSILLHPLSGGELCQRRSAEDWVSWLLSGAPGNLAPESDGLAEAVCTGGFPEPLGRASTKRQSAWFTAYLNQLSEPELAAKPRADYPDRVRKIVRLLAARGSAELVKAKVARQIGIPERTLSSYLAQLGQMHLTHSIPAWGSAAARITRIPKVGLVDTGFAAHLAGFDTRHTTDSQRREYYGSLLELFVANELQKQLTWSAEWFTINHFRTKDGQEVDLVLELRDGRLIAIEAKATQSPNAHAWKNLAWFKQKFGDRVSAGVLLHTGTDVARLHDWLHVLPISSLWQHPH